MPEMPDLSGLHTLMGRNGLLGQVDSSRVAQCMPRFLHIPLHSTSSMPILTWFLHGFSMLVSVVRHSKTLEPHQYKGCAISHSFESREHFSSSSTVPFC